ncbi:MAG: 50S ribosomal protein L25 [Dehalococcoidia bacterium]|nr:50S ribosomal protein L25 [Dehalococcoidia bacterium]
MPETFVVQPRETLGKRVAVMRRGGVIPGNIFGRGIPSTAVQLPERDVRRIITGHGLNTLFELEVAGESVPRSVVVRAVQRHPVSKVLQHVDFYQVDLGRRMQAAVPIHVIGEAPAVHTYKALLLHGVDNVLVEALPAQMPTHLDVSVDGLAELESVMTVADLVLPAGVIVLTSPDVVLARMARQRGTTAEAAEGAAATPAAAP